MLKEFLGMVGLIENESKEEKEKRKKIFSEKFKLFSNKISSFSESEKLKSLLEKIDDEENARGDWEMVYPTKSSNSFPLLLDVDKNPLEQFQHHWIFAFNQSQSIDNFSNDIY